MAPEDFWEGLARFEGRVAQELDDPGKEVGLRIRPVALPIPDALNVDAQLLGNVDLAKPEIKSALAEVVSKGFELSGIDRLLGFSGT